VLGTAWQLADGILWRAWDGEVVAYNELTGDTHHFMDLAAWVFEALTARPATPDGLAQAAADGVEVPPDQDLAASLARTLDLFRTLRLVEPVRAT
jgi:PqqD family protein of HPr-rel-A system